MIPSPSPMRTSYMDAPLLIFQMAVASPGKLVKEISTNCVIVHGILGGQRGRERDTEEASFSHNWRGGGGGEVNPELDPNLESLGAIKRFEEREDRESRESGDRAAVAKKIARSLNDCRIKSVFACSVTRITEYGQFRVLILLRSNFIICQNYPVCKKIAD